MRIDSSAHGYRRGDAEERRGAAPQARAAPKVTEAQLRDLLDRALAEVDADEEAGSLLRATGLRARLRIRDLGLVLDVEPSEEGDHHLRWTFSGLGGPRAQARADDGLAGGERLSAGTGEPGDRDGPEQVRLKGDARCALQYLPAMRVVVDAYRRLCAADYPSSSSESIGPLRLRVDAGGRSA